MYKMLINAAEKDELRVAMVNNNTLIDLDIEHPGDGQKKANIYKGKISSIEPSLGAVFVDYGSERHGFLPLKDIARDFFFNQQDIDLKDVDMRKALRIDQEILVQVDKEERGNKGAALTTYISLAGSYLVLMPTNPRGGGISRRIEGESRDELKALISQLKVPEGMSVIIRTAGVGKTIEELQWDLDLLLRYWDAIFQAAADKTGLIYLIHQESDIVIRSIRDNLRQNIDEIIIDDTATYERVKEYLEKINPEMAEKLVNYTGTLPLFSHYSIEQQIEQAVEGEVKLKSGGSIVIDHTEALVTIDINSARATKGSSIEETALNTNIEAAQEIPRQLRLRDIGGLIVIDFIDMLSNSNQRKVEDALRNALKFDRARIQTGKISRFGLMEMSRQRLSSSLSKNTQITCPRCKGRGSIRSTESTSLAIIRALKEGVIKAGGAEIQVQLPIDVSTYLLNEHRDEFFDIQQKHNANILLLTNQHMNSPDFEIKIGKFDTSTSRMPSYKKVKAPKQTFTTKKRDHKAPVQPAINQYLNKAAPIAPRPKPKSETSLIQRIRDAILGPKYEPPVQPEEKKSRNVKNSSSSHRSGSRSASSKSGNSSTKRNTRSKDDRATRDSQRSERENTQRKPRRSGSSKPSQEKTSGGSRQRNNQKDRKNTSSSSASKQNTSQQSNARKSDSKNTNPRTRKSSNKVTQPHQVAEKNSLLAEEPKIAAPTPANEKPAKMTQKNTSEPTKSKQSVPAAEITSMATQPPAKQSTNDTAPQVAPASKQEPAKAPATEKTSASAYLAQRKKNQASSMQQIKTNRAPENKEETSK